MRLLPLTAAVRVDRRNNTDYFNDGATVIRIERVL